VIPDHLRLQPGQEALTPEQEVEARRFTDERITEQLSTEPVDESEAEQLLRQAYATVGLTAPRSIHWVNGPMQVVALAEERDALSVWESVWLRTRLSLEGEENGANATVGRGVWESVWNRMSSKSVWLRVYAYVGDCVGQTIEASLGVSLRASGVDIPRVEIWQSLGRAYGDACWLVSSRFFDEYVAPNAGHALAHFNELVSGYWESQGEAILIRRPRVLGRDAQGFLHSEQGKCLEYHDGWGFYAWHGVRVSEQVILRPETLTREDFLNEHNVEMRRVIQERMGERFASEMGR
jgi:hypothetical protein